MSYTSEGLIQLGFEWEIDFCIYEDYGLVWKSENPQPTEAECEVAKAEYDSQEYARNRATAYAPLGEQLDMQYHDSVTGSRTWLDHVEEIKARYPK